MNSAHHQSICQLMETYFEGLYQADSTMLRGIFHPQLSYVCANADDAMHLDLETYMARIDSREAPAKRNELRDEAVLEILFGDDRMARVTARMHMMGRDYLDFLTLTRDDTGWKIIAKIFTYTFRND